MRKILVLSVFLLAGCTAGKPTPAKDSGTIVVPVDRKDYDRLSTQVESLSIELEELRLYLESDPKFFLSMMDRDLEAVERGESPRGSFSDYFVPNAAAALKAGASQKEVDARIERIITLAEKKVFLSGFVATLQKFTPFAKTLAVLPMCIGTDESERTKTESKR